MKQNLINQEPWTKEMLEGYLAAQLLIFIPTIQNLDSISNYLHKFLCLQIYRYVSRCLQVCVCACVCVKSKIKNTFIYRKKRKWYFQN